MDTVHGIVSIIIAWVIVELVGALTVGPPTYMIINWIHKRWKAWRCKHPDKFIEESPDGILYCRNCKKGDIY
jgi:hypothetical protein